MISRYDGNPRRIQTLAGAGVRFSTEKSKNGGTEYQSCRVGTLRFWTWETCLGPSLVFLILVTLRGRGKGGGRREERKKATDGGKSLLRLAVLI
jgi:hypothetical protein